MDKLCFKVWLESIERWKPETIPQRFGHHYKELDPLFIEKNIDGWQIIFVDQTEATRHADKEGFAGKRLRPDESEKTKVPFFTKAKWGAEDFFAKDRQQNLENLAKKLTPKISKIVKTINTLGMQVRVPIIINATHVPDYGKSTSGQLMDRFGGAHYSQAQKAVVIFNPRSLDSYTVIHELGHAIFDQLSEEDKAKIKEMAYKLPPPTSYASPHYDMSKRFKKKEYVPQSHGSGDEWFAEMLANIFSGHKGVESWLKKITNFVFRDPSRDIKQYNQSDLETLKGFITSKPRQEVT